MKLETLKIVLLGLGIIVATGCSSSKSGPGDYGGGDLSRYNVTKQQVSDEAKEVVAEFPHFLSQMKFYYEVMALEQKSDEITINFGKGDIPLEVTEDSRLAWENFKIHLAPALKKIYRPGSGLGIEEGFYKIKVNISLDKPCFTDNKVAHDGSSSQGKGEVCISAVKLAQKLDHLNLSIGIRALLAHEVAHEMGANENEAKAIELLFSFLKRDEIQNLIDDHSALFFERLLSNLTTLVENPILRLPIDDWNFSNSEDKTLALKNLEIYKATQENNDLNKSIDESIAAVQNLLNDPSLVEERKVEFQIEIQRLEESRASANSEFKAYLDYNERFVEFAYEVPRVNEEYQRRVCEVVDSLGYEFKSYLESIHSIVGLDGHVKFISISFRMSEIRSKFCLGLEEALVLFKGQDQGKFFEYKIGRLADTFDQLVAEGDGGEQINFLELDKDPYYFLSPQDPRGLNATVQIIKKNFEDIEVVLNKFRVHYRKYVPEDKD